MPARNWRREKRSTVCTPAGTRLPEPVAIIGPFPACGRGTGFSSHCIPSADTGKPGAKFDLRQFHHQAAAAGVVPLALLREHVETRIEFAKSR